MDLYSLLQDTWGCKDQNNTVEKDIIFNNFFVGGHSMNMLEYEVWLAEVGIVNAKLSKFTKVDKNKIIYIQLPSTI
jgi:hypothetical protein